MSIYGLIKATSAARRHDTITDLNRINSWLSARGKPAILSYSNTVRALENSVALGISSIEDMTGFPTLVRGISFYESILTEIKKPEREKFNGLNKD